MSKSKIYTMDGAMGTLLLLHGLPADSCLEEANLTRPRLVQEIHASYIAAGADSLLSNTFGANRPRLSSFGLSKRLEALNREGVRHARKAAGKRPVFASIGPLGQAGRRMGFSEMSRAFREQARALEKEGPDGYVVETMLSLTEAEAAATSIRQVSDAKLFVFMTRPPRRTARTSETFALMAATLRTAGADVIGANCGTHPRETYSLLRNLVRVDPGPFGVRIPAGVPGRLLFPDDFAEWGQKFKKLGCTWIGGCCGTTPAHIRELKQSL